MKFFKLLRTVLLGLLVSVLLVFLIAIAVNWNDQRPSPAARRLTSLIADRALVPDAENAYVYLLGFGAPADKDPAEVGALRRDWLDEIVPAHFDMADDPLPSPLGFRENGEASQPAFKTVCREDARKNCGVEFEALSESWHPSQLDALALARYEQLLTRPKLRESVPRDVRAPLPAYSEVLYAQRMALLTQMQNAKAGKFDEVGRFLRADIAFWRAQQRAANSLISKMIAVAALRNHFYFSNLILRRVPPGTVLSIVPEDWAREFSREERSMLAVMAGEMLIAEATFSELERGNLEKPEDDESDEGRFKAVVRRAFYDFIMLFFQKQDQLNLCAARYTRMADAFDVPMTRYAEADASVREFARSEPHGLRIYNPIGSWLRDQDDGTSYLGYPPRAASLEGMRRAAQLTVQLRSRAVPMQDVPGELLLADLRDPYTGAAFKWQADRRAIVFEGIEDHRWRRHEYFY